MHSETKEIIRYEAAKVVAKRSFWGYCQALEPDFYNKSRLHLKDLCITLDNFYHGLILNEDGKPYENLMINMPPRHGKTRTLVHFTNWMLGKNNQERIIVGSYNDNTAQDFSKYARDGITREKIDPETIIFSDIFPGTKIKRGSSSYMKWALDGQHFNYMGAGIGGSITSKGATVLMFDDLVRSAEDALNENYLNRLWTWVTSTFLSRTEEGRNLKIGCMTRWHKDDPCGRFLYEQPEKWYVVKMEACDENGKMLCDDILNREKYEDIKSLMMDEIFYANYHQKPIDVQGRLYKNLNTYSDLPKDDRGKLIYDKICAYIDTADTGDDFLACGIYVSYLGKAYMVDVYYTRDGMEDTEPETAKRLMDYNVNLARVESNSGGRGFARNVQRILNENRSGTIVRWFHQSKNKQSRILSQSNNVQENIYFPADWKTRWPDFYKHVTSYQKAGKHDHDDAEDMLTGVAESMSKNIMWG